ncbi:MAG: ATP-binding protein [Chitinispirillales bacterium]|jgi:predicted ATPase|nr:ATP-binding protein [Chitinispirillales bacterium]
MAKISIKNVGPVKVLNLDVNRVNIFMGPQSSGKSTIAKIISHCQWIEKDVATSQSLDKYKNAEYDFKKHLEKYHKLNGYFKSDSYVSYSSDVINIEYNEKKFSITWEDQYAYKRSKISYIPSDRNNVALSEIHKVEFCPDSTRSFLFDWHDARKKHSKEDGGLPILNLGVNYYYTEAPPFGQDNINGDSYDISLSDSSSGLQSVTPIVVLVDYLIVRIYEQDEMVSPMSEEQKKMALQKIGKRIFFEKPEIVYEPLKEIEKRQAEKKGKQLLDDEFNKMFEQLKNMMEILFTTDNSVLGDLMQNLSSNLENSQSFKNFADITKKLFTTHNTHLIIEEPEQNLFPETQRDLVYYLLEKCFDNGKEHRLTITTHSPYILYALNNCMLGYLVNSQLNEQEKESYFDNKFLSEKSWIDPQTVSVWEIEDGRLRKIQDKDNIIAENYFDQITINLTDEYHQILNYYKDEDANEE